MAAPSLASLADFLDAHAESLDQETRYAHRVLPQLAAAGALSVGIPVSAGGAGGDAADGVELIAAVAERSLAAAFVLWAQRAFIEYLLASRNAALRERHLAALLTGERAGATGLSNAMKFLSGLEALQITAAGGAGGYHLSGRVPWVTNVPGDGALVAVAVARAAGGAPFVAVVASRAPGVTRSAELDLIALRGTNTVALQLESVHLNAEQIIADDAQAWLPGVRPAFLGLQCGLAIGLTRASLATAAAAPGPVQAVIGAPVAALEADLREAAQALTDGLRAGLFVHKPALLFQLRIRLADLALRAVQLELSASGGRAYHRDAPLGFARRWREAAFIPIVTPSIVQLQGELAKQAARAAAAATHPQAS